MLKKINCAEDIFFENINNNMRIPISKIMGRNISKNFLPSKIENAAPAFFINSMLKIFGIISIFSPMFKLDSTRILLSRSTKSESKNADKNFINFIFTN